MTPVYLEETVSCSFLTRIRRSRFSAVRTGAYILLILAVFVGVGAYNLRHRTIFSCSASGYASGSYLGYCNTSGFGDFDHGAIWFGLEPDASRAAGSAQVLFLGNSRTQFAFSSALTNDWFSSRSIQYYLLGFSHNENYTFEAPLLRRLHSRASVYVINVDSFFQNVETGPGKAVMSDDAARSQYEDKRNWQRIHRALCTKWEDSCGNYGAFFRSRSNGAWCVTGGPFPNEPVSYIDRVDPKAVASYIAAGRIFLNQLPSERACIILTVVPTAGTPMGTARAVAAGLGLKLVAPRLDGLGTFDKVRLDPKSAQRWSAAFLEQAAPEIQQCARDADSQRAAQSDSSGNPAFGPVSGDRLGYL